MMSGARHTLDMTMYELADPQAISILEADAARGVVVRVLLDRAYSGQYVNAPDLAALSAHGVEVRWAPAGTIFHQKTITVDDHESAIMTLNLTSRYYATSRDFAVLTTDPTDVSAIEQTFSADWSGDAVGTGAPGGDLVWSPGATSRLLALIDSARHSLLVENEEMADPAVTSALEAAARRGVAVDLVMTASSSWDSAFGALEAASVEVHTYPSTAALYIHAKVVVADGTTAFVGSQNFSVSSLEYNRELGLVTTDPALVGALERTLSSDFAGAEAFSPPTPTTGRPTTPGTTPSGSGAWCSASAASANDGYSGDYDVTVTSNQPDQQATASDPGDTYSRVTDSGGSATIRLWHTTPGETITISVGGAHCTTTA
jgi:phosphatidylserine/phosphatidylglycerophosphate/cardiolipin synthase-like enzyme